MNELRAISEEQRDNVEKLGNGVSMWFDGEGTGLHIDDYISFDEMAAIVDYLRSQQVVSSVGNMQVGGDHYQTKIQPVEYIHANRLPFIEGNVVKYISRHKEKGGADDIEKAISYCKILLKLEYGYTDKQIEKLFEKDGNK